ncbi:NAD(+) synthase, partial [Roseomonas sp. GC11]|nr:NAD(+) synthase [Roseomonas sp. GC11]
LGVTLWEGGRLLARRARHAFAPGEAAAAAFTPGPAPGPLAFRGLRLGVLAGAEAAEPALAETLLETGAELLLVLPETPFLRQPEDRPVDLAVPRVVETGLPLLALAPLGSDGGAVFPGGAFVLDAARRLVARRAEFDPTPLIARWAEAMPEGGPPSPPSSPLPPPATPEQRLWRALALALRAAVAEAGAPGVALPP